jgi:phage baseplate assembly protein W
MSANLYRGFSTINYSGSGEFSLKDIELVKRDLLNHIYTEKGSRVMMPNFGTRIPLMVFEPNDAQTRAIIEEDLREVFDYDPRVRLINLSVVQLPDNNAIIALADLLYIEFNVKDVLRLEFKS